MRKANRLSHGGPKNTEPEAVATGLALPTRVVKSQQDSIGIAVTSWSEANHYPVATASGSVFL